MPSTNAQEIPRPSLVRQREQQSVQTVPADYNFKAGQVLFTVDATENTTYNDNVFYTRDKPKPDIILGPQVGVNATWRAGLLNTLRFGISAGYSKYLNHSVLDTSNINVGPGSALAFDLYIRDFKIDFHDQFSLQTNPVGPVSGVAQLPRFNNTFGINVLWDYANITWSVGCDHLNFITLGSAQTASGGAGANLSFLNHTTDQISTSASYHITSSTIAGLEGTLSYTNYPDDSAANFGASSAGAFVQLQLTDYTSVSASGGLKGYSPQGSQTSSARINSSGSGSNLGYYANVSLTHRLNKYYSDRLEVAHDDSVDAYSGRIVSDSVRYGSAWKVNSHFTVNTQAFIENVQESAGATFLGVSLANFLRAGATVSTSYKLSRSVSAYLSYQFTKKIATDSSQSYNQNEETIGLEYRF